MFEGLNDILASTGNYKNYRRLLGTIDLPALPYLGSYLLHKRFNYEIAVFLRDLTFIEVKFVLENSLKFQDGNKDLRTNGHVNFEKMSMLSSVFSHVQRFQTQPYNFVEIPGT